MFCWQPCSVVRQNREALESDFKNINFKHLNAQLLLKK